MTTADALPGDMPGLRAAALALIAERDELLRRVGLVVTDVPKVPIWKAVDFNVLRRGMCGNSLISGKRQLFQLNTRSSATEGAWRSRFDL
jgi:hypothetical protein